MEEQRPLAEAPLAQMQASKRITRSEPRLQGQGLLMRVGAGCGVSCRLRSSHGHRG